MNFKKNVVKKHQDASKKAFALFHSTLARLQKEDVEIEKDIEATEIEVQKQLDLISKIEDEKKKLIQIREKNTKFSEKLNEFIEI